MSANDPEREGGPDAEKPEPEPIDIDRAFAAIVAGWAEESTPTWPAQEDLSLGRHRRTDDPPEIVENRSAGEAPEGRRGDDPRSQPPPVDESEPPDRDDLALTGSFGPPALPSVEPSEHGPEDEIGRADAFVPPDPPLPRGDLITTLLWAAVILGPLFLLVSVFWPGAPRLLVLGSVAAFIGGFVMLVARLPRHRDEDDDDGAVV